MQSSPHIPLVSGLSNGTSLSTNGSDEHPIASPSSNHGFLQQLGQQLMATWHASQPERTVEEILDQHLQQINQWFPDQVALATVYIYRETGLLYLERMSGPLQSRILTRTSHPKGAAARIVQHKRPIFVGNTRDWPANIPPIPDHIANNAEIRAYFSLPLLIGLAEREEVIGAILVSLTEPQQFPMHWQEATWQWAQQAALLIQNARVIRRRRREEQAFAAISTSATAADPDEVATVIAEQVRDLTKSAFVTILGYDSVRHVLAARGMAIFGNERRASLIELELTKRSINAYVFTNRHAHYAPNVQIDPYYRIYAGWDEEMEAAFCVPLIVQDQVIGTIYITSKLRDGIATDDRTFLQKLAPHAAVALHLATLMAEERKQRSLQSEEVLVLNKVKKFQADIVDILPVEDQMRQIRLGLDALGLNTDGFLIATYEQATAMIRFPKVREHGKGIGLNQKVPGMRYGPRRLGERLDLVDYVLKSERTLLVEDFAVWPQHAQIAAIYRDDIRSCLAIPLRRSSRIIGVLALRDERPTRFSPADQRLLEAISDEIAIVIDNAQKYDAVLTALQQSVRELHAVSAFQQNISNIAIDNDEDLHGAEIVDIDPALMLPSIEERELQNIYEQAYTAMADVGLETGSMYIALYDEQSKTINLPLIYEDEQPVNVQSRQAYNPRRLGDYPNLIEWILEHRQPLRFATRQALESWGAERGDAFHLPERSRSWIGAPMIARNQLIGVLVLRDLERDNVFSEVHSQLLQTIAGQAAIVIDNARLYERARRAVRQLHALYQAGQSIAAAGLALDDVLHAILQQAVAVTGGYFATLRLVSRPQSAAAGESLELVAVWPPERRAQIGGHFVKMPINGPGIVPLAFRQNRYQLVPDVRTNPHFVDLTGESQSEMAVVLRQSGIAGKTPIGVLNVEHRECNGLTKEDHAGVLVGLTNLAALAINNAQQASELEQVRNDAIVNETVAWMGIFAAESQHTMAQKISSMRYCLDSLHAWSNELPDAQRELLFEITEDLGKIVNEIQAIRPPGTIELRADIPTTVDVELRQSVLTWCEEHNQRVAKPIDVTFDLQCAAQQIRVPARILRIATEKLVHNAFKAMASGGCLTVRSRAMGGQIHIEIADTGPGIPHFARNDFLKRPIQRPHDDGRPGSGHQGNGHQGSGMGALMARIVARRHQGDLLLVESTDVGTTLRLSFPLANPPTNGELR